MDSLTEHKAKLCSKLPSPASSQPVNIQRSYSNSQNKRMISPRGINTNGLAEPKQKSFSVFYDHCGHKHINRGEGKLVIDCKYTKEFECLFAKFCV